MRWGETVSAVPRCWAKRLTRSSSSIQRTRTSRSGECGASGMRPPAATYAAVDAWTVVSQARSRASSVGSFSMRAVMAAR